MSYLFFAQVALPDPSTTQSAAGVLEIVFAGGWVGMSIILFLLALSLTAAYLVFEQLMELRRSHLIPPELTQQVQHQLATGNVPAALKSCEQQPSLFATVVSSGLAEVDGGWTSIERAVEDSLAEQSAALFRKIEYLSVIGNIAPMVGLLGTVTGMIFAFQQVAQSQGGAGAADLAEGIYQALVTTVGGLLVAIPSLGAFAIFRNRVDGLIAEAAHSAQRALVPLKRAVRPPPPLRTP